MIGDKKQTSKKTKNKRRLNDIIALMIILPVLAVLFAVRQGRAGGRHTELLKSGIFLEADFLLMCAAAFLLTLLICMIFRKKAADRLSLFKGAFTAAVGIVMIAMFIQLCASTLWEPLKTSFTANFLRLCTSSSLAKLEIHQVFTAFRCLEAAQSPNENLLVSRFLENPL